MKKMLFAVVIFSLLSSTLFAGMPSGINPAQTDEITWTSLPDCPFYISRANCVKVGDYIYVSGGMGGGFGSWWVTFAAMNIHNNQWTNMTPMSVQFMNMSLVAVNDSIFYALPDMGGNLYKYEPTAGGPQGAWSMVTPLPNPAISTSAAFDGDHLIYLYVNGLTTNVHECYALDINTEILTPISDIPTIRFFPGAAFVNGKFYIFGGQDTSLVMTDNCYEYDPGTDTWAEKSPLIRPSTYNLFNTVVREDLVYLVGGGEPETWPSTDSIQVYDPALDQWSIYETLRTNSYGVNVACYVPEYDYIFDCGGVDGVTFYGEAWKGSFGGAVSDITVTLSPYGTPIQIPAGGGSFDFNIEVANNGLTQEMVDIWTMVTLPNGSEYGPIINFQDLTMNAGWSADRDRTQSVPANAPAGAYTYDAYIGTYPNAVLDEDHFDFTKSATADGSVTFNDWSNWGEDFDGQTQEMMLPSDCILSAFPNPFNPTTTINFNLQTAGFVSLKVYDINGREVANLVDGFQPAGMHEIQFDASELSSGVYLAKLNADGLTKSQKLLLIK